MWSTTSLMVAGLALAPAGPADTVSRPILPAHQPPRFESWEPEGMAGPVIRTAGYRLGAIRRDRVGNGLIGGAIGAVTAVALTLIVANIMDDSARGFVSGSVEELLPFAGAGFALGFVVGLIV